MPTQVIARIFSVAPTQTKILSTPINSDLSLLKSVRWMSFYHPPHTASYSAWLHPDTITPIFNDPGNEVITPESIFAAKDISTEYEQLNQCHQIPQGKHNLAIRINNPDSTYSANAWVLYEFA